MSAAADEVEALADAVMATAYDPAAFVRLVWPWGEPGELEAWDGPDVWQDETLALIGREMLKQLGVDEPRSTRVAIASGHGIGKSANIAMLIIWFMATRPNCRIVVTANTGDQLNAKTWAELAKWHRLSAITSWFSWTKTRFSHIAAPDEWFAVAQTWSTERSEAFAGTHAEHVLMIYDEASRIDDVIWEVSEGAMTTAGSLWVAFGNPTQNTGRFKECFGRYRHRWHNRQIDSRTARHASKAEIADWIADYGEDSDFVRVRVRGIFPRQAATQFISGEVVEQAQQRTVLVPEGTPKLMGVDVARYGDDATVIARRHGRRLEPLERFRGLDVMQVAALVADYAAKERPDTIFVDGVGLGAGVVDRLRQLGFPVVEVLAGVAPDEANKKTHHNKRVEMWSRMRDWLKGADIPETDRELEADLIGPEYGFDDKHRLQLEKKEDMKKRGLASPDAGDALALTFAYLTPPRVDLTSADMEPEAEEMF